MRFSRLVLALTCLLSGFALTRASAAVATGNDYSWPQCAKGVGNGQGQPLPSGSRSFAVVGLTNGQGLHENPCLATEWSYARSHASLVTGYTMVTYPTSTQLIAARDGHYGHCSTLACQLRNHGWAQAAYTIASLAKVGAHPPLVWIDVEPRTHQPWSKSRANNSLVIKAVVAGLQSRGFGVGIYSNRYLWNSIAGYRTTLPEWVPAESLTRGCSMSFAGGRVLMSQWSHTYSNGKSYDENGRCAGAPATASWWQSSHPVVRSVRNSDNGGLYARFGTSPWFSLGAKDPIPAAVVSVPSPAGSVPLFVSVNWAHQLRAGTLHSGWRTLGNAQCADLPVPSVTAGTLSVQCTSTLGGAVITTVQLDAYGSPMAPATTSPAATAATSTRSTTTTLR